MGIKHSVYRAFSSNNHSINPISLFNNSHSSLVHTLIEASSSEISYWKSICATDIEVQNVEQQWWEGHLPNAGASGSWYVFPLDNGLWKSAN